MPVIFANAQKFYDDTITHLISQGRAIDPRPLSHVDRCMYRSAEGKKCAAGFHIPDELYDPAFEGESIHSAVMRFPALEKFFPQDILLASDLQSLHDDSGRMYWKDDKLTDEGKDQAARIAHCHGLTPYNFWQGIKD